MAISETTQGSVVTRLRCGGLFRDDCSKFTDESRG